VQPVVGFHVASVHSIGEFITAILTVLLSNSSLSQRGETNKRLYPKTEFPEPPTCSNFAYRITTELKKTGPQDYVHLVNAASTRRRLV
jgi:hypothetical protein